MWVLNDNCKYYENMLQNPIGWKREIHYGFGGNFYFSVITLYEKAFVKYIESLWVDYSVKDFRLDWLKAGSSKFLSYNVSASSVDYLYTALSIWAKLFNLVPFDDLCHNTELIFN